MTSFSPAGRSRPPSRGAAGSGFHRAVSTPSNRARSFGWHSAGKRSSRQAVGQQPRSQLSRLRRIMAFRTRARREVGVGVGGTVEVLEQVDDRRPQVWVAEEQRGPEPAVPDDEVGPHVRRRGERLVDPDGVPHGVLERPATEVRASGGPAAGLIPEAAHPADATLSLLRQECAAVARRGREPQCDRLELRREVRVDEQDVHDHSGSGRRPHRCCRSASHGFCRPGLPGNACPKLLHPRRREIAVPRVGEQDHDRPGQGAPRGHPQRGGDCGSRRTSDE